MTYPTTPDTTITVGDYVRSYDFAGVVDCYFEGVVEALCDYNGQPSYRIAVNARVLSGKAVNTDALYVWAPVNGLQGIFGVTRGVVRCEEPAL